jgi:hypothetical protein
LKEIVPNIRKKMSAYNTLNSNDYSPPRYKYEVFKESFIPDTVKKWNCLNSVLRGLSSIDK